MANRDQTFFSRFAAVNVSVFGVPSRTLDTILSEMATSSRSYSYFSSEFLLGNILNEKLLVESFIANEDIFDLWKLPGNIITSCNQKAAGSANIHQNIIRGLPLSELFDRSSITPPRDALPRDHRFTEQLCPANTH